MNNENLLQVERKETGEGESRGLILHVEDDRSVREALALLLASEGYSVRGAPSGMEAIDLVAKGLKPDLLIVDFYLADDMDGAETTEQLRRVLGYALPVIMLTGDPSNAAFPWITDMPVWLAHKPMRPQLLVTAVAHLLSLA